MSASFDGLRFSHWQTELRADGIVVLAFDRHGASVNAFSQDVLIELADILERGRADGSFDFDDTRVTAQAACSLPGFLYHWYRPDGRLSPEEMVAELTQLAGRLLGLRKAPHPSAG